MNAIVQPTPAQISSPHQVGELLIDVNGNISINAGRTWLDPKSGRSFMTVNGKAVQIETNATLTKDQWIRYDRAVRRIATQRLVGVADLMNKGLVYPAGDLGTTIAEWDAMSDMTDAEVNMEGVTTTENDTPEFTLSGVPIPIIRKDFHVNLRRLLASRRSGAALDNVGPETASRLVAEKSESILFNGATVKAGGYSIYGYTSHPQRNTGSLAFDWAAEATTGKQVVDDVLAMIDAAEADRHYGPYMLYIPAGFTRKMKEDYSTAKGDNTIKERIKAIEKIEDVKVSDQLAADNVVLVQLTSDVVDLAVVQDITTIQWARGDGMRVNFAVMAGWAPRIKPDHENRLGVVHYTWVSG